MKKLLVSLFVIFLMVGNVDADTQTLSGPTLSSDISGWDDSGLQITALQDVVLEQFIFNNQGAADTIWLMDSDGNILTYTYGGGVESEHTVIVNWQLVAGETYLLVSDADDNGKFAYYDHIKFPAFNDHIRVDGAWRGLGEYPGLKTFLWLHFTNIQTSSSITAVEISFDIKPGSCPNPLNVKSKGVLPVAIFGTEDLDVTDIDAASIRLNEVAALRSTIEDISRPDDCYDFGPDGFDDLVLKFDTQQIVEAIENVYDVEEATLTLTGTLNDGTPIEGEDVVVILK